MKKEEKVVEEKEIKEVNKKKVIIYTSVLLILLISIIFNLIFAFGGSFIKYKSDENIVFFGDSLTSGYDVKKFYPKNNVVNKGVSGDITEDLIERISEDVYEYNPSKVVILIGANDLRKGIDEDDILLNMQNIINGIKINRSHAKIYIQSLYPVNDKVIKDKKLEYAYNLTNKQLIDFNKKLEKLCDENNVEYINMHDQLLDGDKKLKEVYTRDGLHLTNLGYLKVTSYLKQYVEE